MLYKKKVTGYCTSVIMVPREGEKLDNPLSTFRLHQSNSSIIVYFTERLVINIFACLETFKIIIKMQS